jgi:putative integral membrane protein (TIGR02587 family)
MANQSNSSTASSDGDANHSLLLGLARAFGGAVFFAIPLLMTMEMWWLGFYIDRFKLALLALLMVPLLIGLDHYSGFKETSRWIEDVADGMIAYGVGIVASIAILLLFNVINFSMPAREWVGKVLLQAIPAGFGAVLANSQLRGKDNNSHQEQQTEEQRKEAGGYGTELLFLTAGAVFLAFNVAPTEEMLVIAFKMTPWHTVALAIASLLMMHAFVYAVNFRGGHSSEEGTPWWSMFLRFTVVGYAIALLISAYVLWTFGRYEDQAFVEDIRMAIVLGFPASLGAAAARLIF